MEHVENNDNFFVSPCQCISIKFGGNSFMSISLFHIATVKGIKFSGSYCIYRTCSKNVFLIITILCMVIKQILQIK
jgi:hypothetical protein